MGNTLRGPNGGRGLLGRRVECGVLDGVIAAVREGQSRVLVVLGEAGVGKTVLLNYLAGRASSARVVRAVGVETEMELAFAGLHQLCAPMLDRLGRLPGPQREGLEIAFGRSAGTAPDRFLIGLGVLSLLSEVAEERPLVCVVDDAQWLDQASARTLAFVARRLLAEPVGMVFAAREPSEDLRGFPELEVRGLDEAAAHALLDSAVQFGLDEGVRGRIVAETRGNPLALLELPRGMTATQLAGGFGLLGAQAMSGRIERSFGQRLETLPREVRWLLLVAAAEPVGDPAVTWAALARLGVGVPAAAETEGLLEIGARVSFRHPLVRSAVYRSASVQERRAAHRALAEVTDRQTDPDRRAWHLAEAAPEPDENVASELERSAGRAQARGGLAAAAAFRKRAMDLTRDPARRAARALAAAQTSLQIGAFDTAYGLSTAAEAGPLDELGRAQVDLVRAQIAYLHRGQSAYFPDTGTDASALLMQAAKRIETLDVGLARDTYLEAWGAALYSGHLARNGSLLDVSREARCAPQPAGTPRPADLLLDGLAVLITEGRTAAAPILRRTMDACRNETSVEKALHGTALVDVAAWALWDYADWEAIVSRQMRLARDIGAIARLSRETQSAAIAVMWRGDFAAAEMLIAEANVAREATGTPIAPFSALILAALRGREAEAGPLIETALRASTAGGEGLGVQCARWTAAILNNGLGRYEKALAEARQASEAVPELFLSAWALTEQIEAAVRSANDVAGANALERLVGAASVGNSDWGLGIAARSRALMSAGRAAEESYREAIDRFSRTRLRPDLARAHLLYGEWLRREDRRADAREALRTAHDMLDTMGMEAFAERARRELLATGATVRERQDDTRDALTGQEQRIALLARDGLSNGEIGARLFLSPRTVEWHLHKVYAKLGISSRRGLGAALPNTRPAVVAL
jgi:DNA-binding CsgD family transcriptional regulator